LAGEKPADGRWETAYASPETRDKRIKAILDMMAQGKAFHP